MSSEERNTYHHGTLRDALVAAGMHLLATEGRTAISLRACARQAGVSHNAPNHHFGDVSGLLTAVAASGFEQLLQAQRLQGQYVDAGQRLRAMAVAYVRFAVDHPGLFHLMFNDPALRHDDAAYRQAQGACWQEFVSAAALRLGRALLAPVEAALAEAPVLAAWAGMHGLAWLAVEGRVPVALWTDRYIEQCLLEAAVLFRANENRAN